MLRKLEKFEALKLSRIPKLDISGKNFYTIVIGSKKATTLYKLLESEVGMVNCTLSANCKVLTFKRNKNPQRDKNKSTRPVCFLSFTSHLYLEVKSQYTADNRYS